MCRYEAGICCSDGFPVFQLLQKKKKQFSSRDEILSYAHTHMGLSHLTTPLHIGPKCVPTINVAKQFRKTMNVYLACP